MRRERRKKLNSAELKAAGVSRELVVRKVRAMPWRAPGRRIARTAFRASQITHPE